MGETLGISHNVFEKVEREKDRKERLKKYEEWQKTKAKKQQKIAEMKAKLKEANSNGSLANVAEPEDLDDPVEPSEEERSSVQTLNGNSNNQSSSSTTTPKLTHHHHQNKTPVKRASSAGTTSLSSTPNVKAAISLSSSHSSTPKKSPNIHMGHPVVSKLSQDENVTTTKTSVKVVEAARGSTSVGGGKTEEGHQPGLCKCGQKCVIL